MADWRPVKRGGFLEESENSVKTTARYADAHRAESSTWGNRTGPNDWPINVFRVPAAIANFHATARR
jgi:hypothetical protein